MRQFTFMGTRWGYPENILFSKLYTDIQSKNNQLGKCKGSFLFFICKLTACISFKILEVIISSYFVMFIKNSEVHHT